MKKIINGKIYNTETAKEWLEEYGTADEYIAEFGEPEEA